MKRIRLDEHTLEIQFAEVLAQHRPLMVAGGGVAGLADRHTEGCRIQRNLGNERGTATGRGLDRTPQGLAVTDQLSEIPCTAGDLGIV
jgi:hypothetical protein